MTGTGKQKKSLVVAAALFAVLIVTVGLAWACTPEADIGITPQTGQPGDTVIVEGKKFLAGERVEIRWEDRRMRQTLSIAATGPEFAVEVTIPDKAKLPGVIVATAQDQINSTTYTARASFSDSVSGSEETNVNPITQQSVQGTDQRPETKQAGRDDGGSTEHVASSPAVAAAPNTAAVVRAGTLEKEPPLRRRSPPSGSATSDLSSGFGGAPSLAPGLRPETRTESSNPALAAGLALALAGFALAAGSTLVAVTTKRRRTAATRAE